MGNACAVWRQRTVEKSTIVGETSIAIRKGRVYNR